MITSADMNQRRRETRLILALAWGLFTSLATPPTALASPTFPAELIDIDGRAIDVAELASSDHLVVVTLKATWCKVCQRQLQRLKSLLPQLQRCRVNLIVLSPGPAEEIAAIRDRVGLPAHYVEDQGLAIANSLGLARRGDQIFPCMLQILPDGTIGWRQFGRNGAYFGDGELKKHFDCRST